jgi:WG containing repeat
VKPLNILLLLIGLLGFGAVIVASPAIFLPVLLTLAMQAQFNSPYGYIDHSGKVVIDLHEKRNNGLSANDFCEDRAVISTRGDTKKFLIDRTGQIVGPAFYDIEPFSEGLAAVQPLSAKQNTKANRSPFLHNSPYLWGFADTDGKLKIGSQYSRVSPFKEGLAAVVPEGSSLWGFTDTSGKLVIPATFDVARSFSEGLAPVCSNGKWGLINRTGKFVLKPKYDEAISPFKEGLAAVISVKHIDQIPTNNQLLTVEPLDARRDETTEVKYLNRQGNVVLTIHPSPDFSKNFLRLDGGNETRAWDGFNQSATFGWGNKAGFDFSEGLVVMRKGKKYGFIDRTGQFVIAPHFDYAWPFKEGLAKVYADIDGGKYSFINKTGTLISPFIYSSAEDFSEGAAFVKKERNGDGFFIKSNGQPISKDTYNYARNFHCGLAQIGTGIVWP